MRKILSLLIFITSFQISIQAATLFIPMDDSQTDHLKAYGMTYWVLEKGVNSDWLLNYKGGSFAFPYTKVFENELIIRGISYQIMADAQYASIKAGIANPEKNQDVVKLEKAPKVAVYSPKTKLPWDDAVTLVLTYAEIPYEVVYDDEVLGDKLPTFDWLHLHHEDFTGQYGRFYASQRNTAWYKQEVRESEAMAAKHGFDKVSKLKLGVARKIRDFVTGGGYLFAMCSATDSYDIALAADGVDICHPMFDGDPIDPNAQAKLDYSKTFAFRNFKLERDPMRYEYSNIDATQQRQGRTQERNDYFTLFEFSAKWDQIPTMLTQCQTRIVKGFYGQTTAFRKEVLKPNPSVLVLGENQALNEARLIHGKFGYGMWTFYGGHDPEDYRHYINDPKTELSLHPNSPGYRLILNNVLFPAAKKKDKKT